MVYKCIILPSKLEFDLAENTTILQSALNAGIHLAYSCTSGRCGSCKAKLIEGKLKQSNSSEGISDQELQSGYVLTCAAIPESDILLEASYFPELQGIEPRIHPCKIESIEFPAEDVAILKVRLAPGDQIKYLPGQYVEFVEKEFRRSYSIANIKETFAGLEFHIKRIPNGKFSEKIFDLANKNDLLRFKGPIGTFYYRDNQSPVILIAGGTGFAPIKAIIEYMMTYDVRREIYLYWGASTTDGFYSELPVVWKDKIKNFKFIPVYSGDHSEWEGRRGLVHEAVLEDFKDLSKFDVYACGSPDMIKIIKEKFVLCGLDYSRLYEDSFLFSI